jgi:hypothetical protein
MVVTPSSRSGIMRALLEEFLLAILPSESGGVP